MSFFRKGSAPRQAAQTDSQKENKPSINLKVMRPQKFADAPLVADELMAGNTVVMNLERVERDELRHLLDFISGVLYALDGSMKKIAGNSTFILTPCNVALSEVEEELLPPEGAPADPTERPVSSLFSSSAEADNE